MARYRRHSKAAEELWAKEFTGVTVNNTLLNAEVQKGIYDELIGKASDALSDLSGRARVVEIAFILNARHGLRLVERFGSKVSVELHTALADDIDGTMYYAERYYALCPDNFIIKIPFTPSGLIATRRLKEKGIPINLTLGYSARQNFIAAAFAQPDFVNVFLGRLNAYIESNNLGSGKMVGERATVASQRAVKEARTKFGGATRQIAASLRNPGQIAALAGIDVHTIPVSAAREAPQSLSGKWESCLNKDYPVELRTGIDPAKVHLEALWDIPKEVSDYAETLVRSVPQSADQVLHLAAEMGLRDLFPVFSPDERQAIVREGKIPRHERWEVRIERRELALDSLLNAAGLGSFETDQQALDDRIQKVIGG